MYKYLQFWGQHQLSAGEEIGKRHIKTTAAAISVQVRDSVKATGFFVELNTKIESQREGGFIFVEYTFDFKVWYITNLLITYGTFFIHNV